MSWTDKKAVQMILKLRDEFFVTDFVETGTFKGVNAKLQSLYFQNVFSCEINETFYKEAVKNLPQNVQVFNIDSSSFLNRYLNKFKLNNYNIVLSPPPIIYLDAHFFDEKRPRGVGKFIVLDELKVLEGFNNCIIVIHDFDCNNLGHIVYDEISLNFDLVKDSLNNVNPNFKYYTNSREYCDIITLQEVIEEKIEGIEATEEVLDNLKYVWSKPEKTYRGILYAVPRELDLSKYELKELK